MRTTDRPGTHDRTRVQFVATHCGSSPTRSETFSDVHWSVLTPPWCPKNPCASDGTSAKAAARSGAGWGRGAAGMVLTAGSPGGSSPRAVDRQIADRFALRTAAAAAVFARCLERIRIHPRVPEHARLGLAVFVDLLVAREAGTREAGYHAFPHQGDPSFRRRTPSA